MRLWVLHGVVFSPTYDEAQELATLPWEKTPTCFSGPRLLFDLDSEGVAFFFRFERSEQQYPRFGFAVHERKGPDLACWLVGGGTITFRIGLLDIYLPCRRQI